MIYRGFDITMIVPIKERTDIDENGNSIAYRDAWQSGDQYYEGVLATGCYSFIQYNLNDLKAQIDAHYEQKARSCNSRAYGDWK